MSVKNGILHRGSHGESGAEKTLPGKYPGGKRKKALFLTVPVSLLVKNDVLDKDPMQEYEDATLKARNRKRVPVFLTRDEALRLIEAIGSYHQKQKRRRFARYEARDRAMIPDPAQHRDAGL